MATLARMWLALAVLLTCLGSARAQVQEPSLSPPPDLTRFVGKAISRAEVVIDDETWSDVTVPTISSVKSGEIFVPSVARRAMDEIASTGRFAQARATVANDGAGVRLVVHVVQRKIVLALSIDTHGALVEKDEVQRETDLSEGGEILGINVAAQKKRLLALFARRGYPQAEATITTRPTDDPQKVLVYVDVQPGPPRLLQKRVFYVSDPEVTELRHIVAREYGVDENDRADEAALDAADTKLETSLRARGYHNAEVSHDVVTWQGQVTLRVRVDTGPGVEPRFEGNDHYDATALSGALDLPNETDRTPGHLVQKLKDFYAKRGWLDTEVTVETRGGERDRLHLLVFKIREHRRVAVAMRSYPCLKEDEIKRLREGGPRSASAIGNEIDSYLEEELPGADLLNDPNPRVLDALVETDASRLPTGARPVPVDLEPNRTYVADTYERALAHVQELYRNEGFLNAQVGPAQVVRRRCALRSPPGTCIPVTPSAQPPDACTYDATNLPLPVPPLDPALSCTPDPLHGIECEPRIELRIPVKLGPRTHLYDLAFSGVKAFSEQKVADAANIPLGQPVNTLRLEDARRRIVDLYKEAGYAYVDVKYTLDTSVDHTRARVRFDVVENDQVLVRDIVIVGNRLTHEWTIRRRIALEIGKPYATSLIRKTQERISTLNVFSSVTIGLADPYVPQKSKVVVITVTEGLPKALEQQAGFTTGEGVYYGLEYDHSNLLGYAIGLTIRGRLSYLPTPFILDPQVKTNFTSLGDPGFDKRIAGRATVSLTFPEIGLGPLVRTQLDAVVVHDLQRDFYITKLALIPSLQYRPLRELSFAFSPSVEDNFLRVFQYSDVIAYERALQTTLGQVPPDLSKYLLVPDGESRAIAQRLTVAWDRRDDSFNASRGTYFVSGLEHVDSYPVSTKADNVTTFEGHFLRFTETFAGYIPLFRGVRIAAELRLGTNMQLTPTSQTYPDRLFFMGGSDSMRGWALRSFLPQDDIDQIRADFAKADCTSPNSLQPVPCNQSGAIANPNKFTAATQPVRGGNLMINPKIELRIPIMSPLEMALFSDIGNLWRRASYPLDTGKFPMRVSVGAGLRVQTPVGPLALDYGINVTRDQTYAQEDFGALHFAIGLF